MISATVHLDSISAAGVRLTTFVLKYPRFIHAQMLTHRVFSRNSSSSRAIPVDRQIEEVLKDPVVPLKFSKNQKGMQGGEEIDEPMTAFMEWLDGRDRAVETAQRLRALGVHKQIVNRVLEPYVHVVVIVTATEFDNFFALRYHGDAQDEVADVARRMWEAYGGSTPWLVPDGQWHLPFTQGCEGYSLGELLTISVARCARVSYKTHEGNAPTYQNDLALYQRLLGASPVHASPAEHQAMAVGDPEVRSGNFRGWVQYRQTLPNHTATGFAA